MILKLFPPKFACLVSFDYKREERKRDEADKVSLKLHRIEQNNVTHNNAQAIVTNLTEENKILYDFFVFLKRISSESGL